MDDVQALVETEAIKRLKARYARALDTKDWEWLGSLFTPDARSTYNDGNFAFEGRDAIIEFLEGALGTEDIVHLHQAHTPEIEITSDTTARGSWYLEDTVINPKTSTEHSTGRTVMTGTGIYHDEYTKVQGEWLISKTGYERIFEYTVPYHPDADLKTRWNR
ncbi:MAG: nuclear transport factor 2 family protein [Gemmatimonadetes bacterium]|nr:nuclear transport factor 2 family protein [Gemmatimonadota bacterium]